MKKLLFVCAFVMGICAVSFAQGRQQRTPEESAAALKTSLTLNDDQTAKVKTIYEVQAKSMDSLRTAAGGDAPDRATMMAKRTPITNATNAKIKAILTADQAATFQKQIDAQAERMKQFMQGGN